MPTTIEIVEDYRKNGGWITFHHFGTDEIHTDNGEDWFVISVFSHSLYEWLETQCETNYEHCGRTSSHEKWPLYPRYNVNQSIMMYIQLKWA